MPSLIRLIVVLGVLAGIAGGTLYTLAVYFEPEPKEISTPIRNLELKKR